MAKKKPTKKKEVKVQKLADQTTINFGITEDKIIMQFSQKAQWISLSAAQARELGTMLFNNADTLDRKGSN